MKQHRKALVSCVLGLLVVLTAARAQAQYEPELEYRDPDRYTLNWSARLVLFGGGAACGPLKRQFVMDTAIHADFLWGKPGDEHVRFGPALELRTASFHTLEAGAGASVLLPVFRGYPIQLTVVGGYALRRGGRVAGEDGAPDRITGLGGNGLYVANSFSWGYRSFNWHGSNSASFNAYIQTRHHLDRNGGLEVVGGIELDLSLAVGVPARVLIQLFRKGDPDEPEEDEEDEASQETTELGPRRIGLSRAIAF